MKPSILIVDDEKLLLHSLKTALSRGGYQTLTAASGEEALESFRVNNPDIILLDVKLPEMDGMQVLKKIKAVDGNVPVIIMTAFSGIKGSVEAIKLGAHDYIAKPFDIEELKFVLARSLASQKAVAEVNQIRSTRRERYSFDNIITGHPKIREIIDLGKRLARNAQSTVLIMGESGTGKELFANAIHYNGPRSDSPLITVNCAALSEGLLESELFGHEKGAFTSAVAQRKGKFELADQGTIFLDEVADLSPNAQAKVLRVTQGLSFERVGGEEKIEVDVRIIAATNKDIEQEIKAGRFREDLYFRLNVIPINVPPLRERIKDLPLLVSYFLEKFKPPKSLSPKQLSAQALRMLTEYAWPGNIRELKNFMERVNIMTEETVIDEHTAAQYLGALSTESDAGRLQGFDHLNLNQAKDEFEKEFITQKLKENKNNIAKTAHSLGLYPSNLHSKLKKYGITVERGK